MRRVGALLLMVAVGVGPGPAVAQDRGDEANPTPPRLAFVEGDVSFWRPGAEDWAPAQVNTPLAEGDELYADTGGRIELQIGPRAFVRAGGDTQIGLETLDVGYLQFKLTGGRIALDLKQLPEGQTVEIDTPAAAVIIDEPGYYRVDVDDRGTSFAVRRGRATVVASDGTETEVGANQRGFLGSNDTGLADLQPIGELDEWDLWNDARTSRLPERPRSAEYVSRHVTGVDDLDEYGDWREEPRYGRVWVPRNVGPDWAPYSTGRWVYDPYYDWTWVDDAPWGWAPYHYGRWVHVGGYWGWAPGPVVVQPAYAPALVAFFSAPGVSVSVGLPFVSWCALGWGEPVVPWWGPRHFVGTPWWGGWGGPRVVNNVVINNWYGVNARQIHRYENMNVRHAVVGVERGRFGRGGRHVRLDNVSTRMRPLHGRAGLGIKPGRESFVTRDGRGKRPPQRFQERQVVATRSPRDPMQRLRGKGVDAAAAPTRRAGTRVVQARGGRHRGRDVREGGPTSETARGLGGGREDRGRRGGGRHQPEMQGQGPQSEPRLGGRDRQRNAGRAVDEAGRGWRRQRDRGGADTARQVPDEHMGRPREQGRSAERQGAWRRGGRQPNVAPRPRDPGPTVGSRSDDGRRQRTQRGAGWSRQPDRGVGRQPRSREPGPTLGRGDDGRRQRPERGGGWSRQAPMRQHEGRQSQAQRQRAQSPGGVRQGPEAGQRRGGRGDAQRGGGRKNRDAN
jgi:hypothetical protein